MPQIVEALLLALMAGAAIPLGGWIACIERLHPRWLEQELRHSVIAFGGGVLLAAIAFVLVPQGTQALTVGWALLAMGAGGVAFLLLDRWANMRLGRVGQLLAMLADFLPEAVALGALLASGAPSGLLLALLIALQNLPEGFNAWRELAAARRLSRRGMFALFWGIAALGPLAALAGHVWLSDRAGATGAIMLFAAGGILYLIFQDIAPQTPLRRHWGPPLGAVAGFMAGLAGHLALGG